MKTWKHLTLVTTLVGLFSGPWIGYIPQSSSSAPQAVAPATAPVTPDTPTPAVLAPAVSLPLASVDLAASVTEDTGALETPPVRRGGGIGLNLKK